MAFRSPAPPGRLVDVGGFKLHVNCAGEGSPAVVLDAALGGSSISWSLVQPDVAADTRVCSYDRAGFGWSEAGPMPRTASRIAGELHVLLDRAGVPPPFVLVGHSFGGFVMRIFAGRYRSDVAGLVLVDPAHPADWMTPSPKEQLKIERGRQLCRHGTAAARMGIARVVGFLAELGAINMARGMAQLVSRGGLSPRGRRHPRANLAAARTGTATTAVLLDAGKVLRRPRQPDRVHLGQRVGSARRISRRLRRSAAHHDLFHGSGSTQGRATGGARAPLDPGTSHRCLEQRALDPARPASGRDWNNS